MAPSDVKRFVAYLNDLTAQSAAKPAPADEPPSAAATDFEDTLELLQQYQQDERVRNLLMDTSEETLDSTLDNVRRQLREVETQSIGAYIQASKPLDELHTQIRSCDDMLGRVEARLGHFDAELSTVNREIQSLEEDSDQLTAMLRNRIAAADALARWLQSTTVPPDLVQAVRDGDVADAEGYTATLHELRSKMAHMRSFVGHEDLQAFPTLKALEVTAAGRVKAFLLERIGGIRPGGGGASNATMRRQGLLAFREYATFLRGHAPPAYKAVLQRYIDDNRLYLSTTVRAYTAGLAAATLRKERSLLVTPAELAGRGFNTRLSTMFLPGNATEAHVADFELGSRAEELLHPDFSRWPSQALRGGSSPTGRAVKLYQPIALQTIGKQKVPQEHAFKALTHQICAAAAGEYAFLEIFFAADAAHIFDECWKPVMAMVIQDLDAQLAACYDVISVLIMTRIVAHCQLQMTHAQVPVLTGFLDRLGLMLWPHFSRLIREHIDSITLDKANAKAQALKPPAPCVLPCTRRWAALFASIGRLNAEYSDSQIHNNLEELSRALHTLLYRIRLLFAKPHEGAVFHIVNVRHVVSAARAADAAPVRTQLSSEVLPQNSGGLGADAMAICAMFEATLELARAQYRDEVLSSHVKELVAYVAKAHGLTKAGREPRELREALGDVPKARKIMQDFKDRWKAMVGVVRQEVEAHFAASEACQQEMTRACLEALYQQYKDFLGVLALLGEDVHAVAREGPSLQTLAYELREMVR